MPVSPRTQEAYLACVRQWAKHFNSAPELIMPEQNHTKNNAASITLPYAVRPNTFRKGSRGFLDFLKVLPIPPRLRST